MKSLFHVFWVVAFFVSSSLASYAECKEDPVIGQRSKDGKCYEYMVLRDCNDHHETEVERECGSEGIWNVIYDGPLREGGGAIYPTGPITFDSQGNAKFSVLGDNGGHWILTSVVPSVAVDFIPDSSSMVVISGGIFAALDFPFQ